MNRTNFHTHTYRCGHAEGTERDYVEAAAAMGMPRLGMSDHGAYPDDSGCNRMPYSEVDEYIGILASLKNEFASRLELFIGFELEYIPEFEDYYRSLIEERGVDYLALGQHIFTPPSGELVSAFGIESSEDYIHYARSVADGMRTGIYDFVAHPDLMYFVPLPRDINFDRAADIIIDAAAETGIPLELNANGLRRELIRTPDGDIRYPYPYEPFWRLAASAKIKTVIGSDCHQVELLNDEYVDEAYRLAQEYGLEIIEL